MKKGTIITIVAIVAVLAIYCISAYNSMVKMDENVTAAWAQVETQYQRRADLIPQLVNVVKGAADYERKTLESVIEARSKATSIQLTADDLTEENPAKFQKARIAVARKDFNETVQKYNSYIRRFPKNIFAGMFGFEQKAYFKAAEGAENAPEVNFNFE